MDEKIKKELKEFVRKELDKSVSSINEHGASLYSVLNKRVDDVLDRLQMKKVLADQKGDEIFATRGDFSNLWTDIESVEASVESLAKKIGILKDLLCKKISLNTERFDVLKLYVDGVVSKVEENFNRLEERIRKLEKDV